MMNPEHYRRLAAERWTPEEHYLEAEALLRIEAAVSDEPPPWWRPLVLARAQVHATLATAQLA